MFKIKPVFRITLFLEDLYYILGVGIHLVKISIRKIESLPKI